MKSKAVFNWSGGKDSALALYKALQSGLYDIVALLTTVNKDTHRSTMHYIPLSLLEQQSRSIGIPLYVVDLAPRGDLSDYGSAMQQAVDHFKQQGVSCFIFGDIHLHDVRSYRQKHLHPLGIEVVEPLWEQSPDEVLEEFLCSGIEAVVVSTTADMLDETFVGRSVDRSFIASLPDGVDLLGENGEYHTFVHRGGAFRYPISFRLGPVQRKSYPVRLSSGDEHDYTYCFSFIDQESQE